MVIILQELTNEIDNGGRIGAVFIDFNKAFDIDPNYILIEKLDKTKSF